MAKGINLPTECRPKRRLFVGLCVVWLFVVLGAAAYVAYDLLSLPGRTQIVLEDAELRIEGRYPLTLSLAEDVAGVKLLEAMPAIGRRVNGVSHGSVRAGYFRLKNGEDCFLCLKGTRSPVIRVLRNDGSVVYLGMEVAEETRQLYGQLLAVLKRLRQ